jgi:Predicted nucleotide-binding protein containing TIR-like domain
MTSSRRVFVVHGRDLLAREAVARVLRGFDLEPVVLADAARVGQTWIEALEEACDDCAFAVVIYKADDRGALWSEPHRHSPRARQNVLFELGFMIGRLGRSKVCVLHEEGVDIPSDYAGARFVKLDTEWDWKLHLAVSLEQAGLPVKMTGIISDALRAAPNDQEFIRDQVERTKRIVNDLRSLATADSHLRKEVRFSGFLSAFALGHPEEMSERLDGLVLPDEKVALLDLARNGCHVFCIITVPRTTTNRREACFRLSTLLEFLTTEDSALHNIYWAVAPRIESYVYIVSDISFFQGFKGDDLVTGFALTERRTGRDELHRQTTLFDERFNMHAAQMLRKADIQRGGDRREDLLRATIKSVQLAFESMCRNGGVGQ